MWFRKKPLHIEKQHEQPAPGDVELLRERAHRLEIALVELKERLESLEGRHASLSASVRGRLGGRPNPRTGLGNHATPLPINPMIR